MTQFYQAFPRVSTASDERWGEKAWVQGYPNPGFCCKIAYKPVKKILLTSRLSVAHLKDSDN